MKYTFEMKMHTSTYPEFVQSSLQFESIPDAADAAREWLYVSAINGVFPMVRIVVLNEIDK